MKSFIKIGSTPASLSYKGQVNMHTTINGQLRFQAPLSSSLEKNTLVARNIDFADSTKIIDGRGTMIKYLSPRNSSTEPSRKWKLNITWSKKVYLSKSNSRKDI